MTAAATSLTRRRPMSASGSSSACCFLAAALGVVTTVGIIVVLAFETLEFFLEVSPVEFFTGTQLVGADQAATPGACCRSSPARCSSPGSRCSSRSRSGCSRRSCSPSTPRRASGPSSSRSSRRSPASRRSCSASSRLNFIAPQLLQPLLGTDEHRDLLGAVRRDRGRAADHAADRLDLRGRDARGPARHARGRLRDGRDEVRGRPQGRLPGGPLGDHGLDHPGHEPGHRRDDGRRRWRSAPSPSSRSTRPRASRR